jgi:signal transduction histidine kinase
LAATAVVAAALVVGAIALVSLLRAGLWRSLHEADQLRVAELAAIASRGPLPDPLPTFDAPQQTLVQVLDSGGRVIAASGPLRGLGPLVDPNGRRPRVLRHASFSGGPWLVQVEPATLAGQADTVIVLASLINVERSIELLGGLLVGGLPLVVAMAAAVCWLLVGRALRPVEAMRAAVSGLDGGRDLQIRVPEPATGDEVERLARTLNEMLDRLGEADERQRRFVADASHELRTPLANIRTAMEVASRHPLRADWPALAADVLAQDARMERLVSDLLVLARADAGHLTPRRTPCDLAEIVRSELDRPVPPGVRLDAGPLPPSPLTGDPDGLARVVANLVDNALRHASSRVAVSLTPAGRWVELTVRDDGPGIPRADRQRVFERFVRLDEHRSRSDPPTAGRAGSRGGAGLGLAIVAELVAAHGGVVRISDGPGAVLTVRLPLR